MGDLRGKTALVTGASRGIGRSIAEALAAEGATVAVNHPPSEDEAGNARKVAASVESNGGEAFTVEADVRIEDSVQEMVETVEERAGALSVLVNNAGGSPPTATLSEMAPETWDQVLGLDLRGVYLSTHFALPGMLEIGDNEDPSRVINVASQQGIKGAPNRVHYCAAKGGVIAFTRALAREVAPRVTVNAIAPGPIQTGKREDSENWASETGKTVPLGRVGDVGDVAPTAVLLAGPSGAYYTGQTLSPDGGDAMH